MQTPPSWDSTDDSGENEALLGCSGGQICAAHACFWVLNWHAMSFSQIRRTTQTPEQTALSLKCLFIKAGYLYTVKRHKLWPRLDPVHTETQTKEYRCQPVSGRLTALRCSLQGSRTRAVLAPLLRHLSLPDWTGQATKPPVSDLV